MKITHRDPVGKVLETPVEIDVTSVFTQHLETPKNAFHATLLLALGVPQAKVSEQMLNRSLPDFSLDN